MKNYNLHLLIAGAFALSSCAHLGPNSLSKTPGNSTAKAAFTYKIDSSYKILSGENGDPDFDKYQLNGEDIEIAKDRAIANFYNRNDEKELPEMLSKNGAKIISHMWTDMAQPIVSGSPKDGTAKVVHPEPIPVYDPLYLIEVVGDENDDLSDLEETAKATGVTGNFTFPNKRVASQMRKIWKMNMGLAGAPIFTQNARMIKQLAATAEGVKYPSTNYSSPLYAPTAPEFYWVGRANGSPYGGNLNNASTGEHMWGFANGNLVNVGVIDYEFQGATESAIPWRICNKTPVRWNAATQSSTGFAGPLPSSWSNSNTWHGRRCASLIFAGNGDQGGTLGTAPSANPYLMKMDGTDFQYAACYNQAAGWSCKVINISQSVPSAFSSLNAAIQNRAQTQGTIAVAAAGNSGNATIYPSAWSNVIGVGALDQSGNKASTSNSWNVDIYAPGVNLALASNPSDNDQQFRVDSGTSFAAPMVAGVIAGMVQKGYVTNFSTTLTRIQNRGLYKSTLNARALDSINMVRL